MRLQFAVFLAVFLFTINCKSQPNENSTLHLLESRDTERGILKFYGTLHDEENEDEVFDANANTSLSPRTTNTTTSPRLPHYCTQPSSHPDRIPWCWPTGHANPMVCNGLAAMLSDTAQRDVPIRRNPRAICIESFDVDPHVSGCCVSWSATVKDGTLKDLVRGIRRMMERCGNRHPNLPPGRVGVRSEVLGEWVGKTCLRSCLSRWHDQCNEPL